MMPSPLRKMANNIVVFPGQWKDIYSRIARKVYKTAKLFQSEPNSLQKSTPFTQVQIPLCLTPLLGRLR
jgi:hypothetical protein